VLRAGLYPNDIPIASWMQHGRNMINTNCPVSAIFHTLRTDSDSVN